MEHATRILIDKIGIALSLLLAGLALLGEVLGWWNDLGVVLTLVSLVLGVVAVLDLNGAQILAIVSGGMGRGGWVAANQAAMLENQAAMLESQVSIGGTLDRIEVLLDARR